MFVQVIRGKVKDAGAMRARADSWTQELGPGAKGWLGATEGITDDGTFVAVVRFESEEAARANNDRPEQGEWFRETEKLFDGPVTFYNCPEADTLFGGGSDDAGFVQIMIYKPSDIGKFKELTKKFADMGMDRADFIGATTALATDGTVIDTNYFTSEAEARKGEKQEMPADVGALMKEFMDNAGNVEYLDLRDPILQSP